MTIKEFKRFNKEVGQHWFSPDTMKFFNTKIEYWEFDTGFFITLEHDHLMPHMYSVRKADFDTGKVETIGEFHSHKSLQAAKEWLKGYKEALSETA